MDYEGLCGSDSGGGRTVGDGLRCYGGTFRFTDTETGKEMMVPRSSSIVTEIE